MSAPPRSTTPGTSPEAILIPYTELRERLDELPRDKPVYTYCRSGFRSYIAYEVLKQHGFRDVAFLAGGMLTFHGFHRTPLKVGESGMPIVTNHVEDVLADHDGARTAASAPRARRETGASMRHG